jgi:hypothetical protein
VRFARIIDRARDGWNRRFVKDQLDIFERASRRLFVGQTRPDEIHLPANLFQILGVPGRKVVNHANARAPGRERRSNVRPDKASAACDKYDS